MISISQIPRKEIFVAEDRQRRELDQDTIIKLAQSIDENGLIHPILVSGLTPFYRLVVGERRLRAMEFLWLKGKGVRFGGLVFPRNYAPSVLLSTLDPIDAEEIELEENIRREDLSWQDLAAATSRLADLRAKQAALRGQPPPSMADLARELKPEVTKGLPDGELGGYQAEVRKSVLVGIALRDPAKAAAMAPATTQDQAFKLLKRHEEAQRNAELSRTIGATFSSSLHHLLKGDCVSLMQDLPAASFDVILTDPPYGIGADEFSDSGGRAAGSHFYEDSEASWRELAKSLSTHSARLAKPQAHLYCFCDIDRFTELKAIFASAGWKVFRTPLIWHKPNGMRAPWPEAGPQRKYEVILYATRGNRPVTRLYSDLISYPADDNLGHNAQKPVALFKDLLVRSIRPGDTVLDPFCGSGTIFPASHELKCIATGIEMNDSAHGIAVKRLEGLK